MAHEVKRKTRCVVSEKSREVTAEKMAVKNYIQCGVLALIPLKEEPKQELGGS